LIVVFTKGDQLESHFSEYPDVWEYIQTSELDAYQIDLEQYIQKMSVISERLKTFSQETLGAYAFYNMAIDRFARVEFCLTSALGSQPEGETLSARISPRRITDPLLWAMLSTQTTPINRR
jgi:hypothetical protein